jgi:hypothetical protein
MKKNILVLLLSLVAAAAQANCVKSAPDGGWVDCETGKSAPAPVPKSPSASYNHVPASLQATACSDPEQQAGCKIYFAGFADTVAMMYAMNSKANGICGDTTDIVHEFIQAVQTNPKARDAETHALLFALVAKNHSCNKTNGNVHSGISAGHLVDTCKIGESGFSLCSQYETGFISALLFMSEQIAAPIVCGDQRLLNSVSLSGMFNDSLQSNFKLRRDPAVTVMLNALMASMPCPNR